MDIAIAAIAGLAQFVSAFLGWRVSMKPPKNQRQAYIYEAIFIIAGIMGIGAVVLTAHKATMDQAELRSELRSVTGADNFVYLRPNLAIRTDRGFQLFTAGRGGIAGGVFNVVPASATDTSHPDYRASRPHQFLALHSGMALEEFLDFGDWRIEFVSLTTGHYNQLIEISEVDGKPVLRKLRVMRGTKQIFPEEK